MADNYTGVKVIYSSKEVVDEIFKNGHISLDVFDGRLRLVHHQNMFLVVKGPTGGSALCWIKGNVAKRLKTNEDTCMSSIRPRNKEQCFAFEALLDDSIPVVSLAGRAGTGKTVQAISAALHKVEKGIYKRIILTRNMTQVGKNGLGFLPGDVMDKFLPFNQGYLCNMEYLLGGSKTKVEDLISQLKIEFVPLQLVRGASWPDSFVILDESQNCTPHEVLSFGSRIGENSKVVLLGDLQQRDISVSREGTGLYRFVNSSLSKESQLVAHIELIKSERGPVSELFSRVFEDA